MRVLDEDCPGSRQPAAGRRPSDWEFRISKFLPHNQWWRASSRLKELLSSYSLNLGIRKYFYDSVGIPTISQFYYNFCQIVPDRREGIPDKVLYFIKLKKPGAVRFMHEGTRLIEISSPENLGHLKVQRLPTGSATCSPPHLTSRPLLRMGAGSSVSMPKRFRSILKGNPEECLELDLSYNVGDATDEITEVVEPPMASLSPKIKLLVNLKHLDLRQNALTTLPDEIGLLVNLNVLILYSNKISSLPASMANCVSLTKLDLYQNELKVIPNWIGALSSLEVLSLHENEIEEIPPAIEKLTKLKVLNLSTNRLGEGKDEAPLSSSICMLLNLNTLDVSNNRLTALPEEMRSLKGLRQLHAKKNRIRSLPMFPGELPNLKSLVLLQNTFFRDKELGLPNDGSLDGLKIYQFLKMQNVNQLKSGSGAADSATKTATNAEESVDEAAAASIEGEGPESS